ILVDMIIYVSTIFFKKVIKSFNTQEGTESIQSTVRAFSNSTISSRDFSSMIAEAVVRSKSILLERNEITALEQVSLLVTLERRLISKISTFEEGQLTETNLTLIQQLIHFTSTNFTIMEVEKQLLRLDKPSLFGRRVYNLNLILRGQ